MSNPRRPLKEHAISEEFDLRYYVDVSHEASTRTRTVTIILVVACVLVSIGWYNSFRWSWAREKIRQAYDPTDNSITKILRPHDPPTADELAQAEKYRNQLQIATVYHYVENVRFIKVPFFGIAFDVNDLGTIGGLAILTILVLLRYSLSREIKNLNVSFEEAYHHDQLSAFYHALAMRQLFTVPHMKGETQNWKLARLPELVGILPAIIFSLGVLYDLISTFILSVYNPKNVSFTLITESICLLLIWALSWKCLMRKKRINSIWDSYWRRMPEGQKTQTSVIMLDRCFVKKFGSDEAVNNALIKLRQLRSEFPETEKKGVRASQFFWKRRAKLLLEAEETNNPLILLDNDLVKEFGNDKAVNDALRKLRKMRSSLQVKEK